MNSGEWQKDSLGRRGVIACDCPNCDDPHNGGECLRGFCQICLEQLDDDSLQWGEKCHQCDEVA